MKINTNIPALKVLKQVNQTDTSLSRSLERLSSGKKINSASDDAAGLAISEKMQIQIDALTSAKRSANDGISLVQTAEGALNEVHSILQRARELAVEASNDTLSTEDRQAVEAELNALRDEINRISRDVEFNGMTLLDGSINVKTYIPPECQDLIDVVNIEDGVDPGRYNFYIDQSATKTTVIGKEVTLFNSNNSSRSGSLFINGQSVKILESDTVEEVYKKIRDTANITGVNVTTTENQFSNGNKLIFENSAYGNEKIDIAGDEELIKKLGLDKINMENKDIYRKTFTTSDLTSDANDSLFVNGVKIDIKTGETLEELAEKLCNAEIPGAGFSYDEETGTLTVDSIVPLTIKPVDNTSTNPAIELIKNGLVAADDDKLPEGSTSQYISGVLGRDASVKFGKADGTLTGFDDLATSEKDGFPNGTTVTVEGNRILFTAIDGFELLVESNNKIGDVELNILQAGELDIQIGANEGQTMSIRIPNMSSKALNLENVNVKTATLADKAIVLFDEAIQRVSEVRSKLGAFQNRLEYTVNSLDSTNSSLTSSLSAIIDTDMAEEISNYTQLNVLSQASMSILAQANQRPEAILQLLNNL